MPLQANVVGSLRSLTSALSAASRPKQTAPVMLIELDGNGRPAVVGQRVEALRFQYFPDSFNSSKAPNYAGEDAPGGSLPVKGFVASGDHNLTFTAYFTCDQDLVERLQQLGSGQRLREVLAETGQLAKNPDLRAAFAWLRRYVLPTYGIERGASRTVPPKKLRLFIPNSGIGLLGGMVDAGASVDSVECVMTQCEVNITAFFSSGLPRTAEVQLGFSENLQRDGSVRFPHAAPLDAVVRGTTRIAGYTLTGSAVLT